MERVKNKKSKRFRAILRAIKENIALLLKRGPEIRLLHTKGHQDDAENFHNLSK